MWLMFLFIKIIITASCTLIFYHDSIRVHIHSSDTFINPEIGHFFLTLCKSEASLCITLSVSPSWLWSLSMLNYASICVLCVCIVFCVREWDVFCVCVIFCVVCVCM